MFKKIFIFFDLIGIFLIFILKRNGNYFRIFTHMTQKERLALYKIALSLKRNSVIVEIGSYLGASSVFLACAAKEKNHVVYCCDTWKNDAMKEGARDTFNEFCDNIKPLSKFICILRGRSVELAASFDKIADLIFIDGDHSFEAVKADIDAWLPRVKDGGIMVFHDFGGKPGVTKAINEYIIPISKKVLLVDTIYVAEINKKRLGVVQHL